MYDEFYGFEEEYNEDEEYEKYLEMVSEEERQRKESGFYDDEDDGEIWLPVVGYEGLYEVSNMGRIRSLDRLVVRPPKGSYIRPGQMLNPLVKRRSGYPTITLRKDNESWRGSLHQIVATTFIPNPENKPYVDHINAVKTDNRVENLRWATRLENNTNPISCYHNSISKKGRPSKLKGRHVTQDDVEKRLVTKQEKGIINLPTDENGNLIYKNGIIDINKYNDKEMM